LAILGGILLNILDDFITKARAELLSDKLEALACQNEDTDRSTWFDD